MGVQKVQKVPNCIKASQLYYKFSFQYAEMETILGDIDRARAIYELAINQSLLDMPEVCRNNEPFFIYLCIFPVEKNLFTVVITPWRVHWSVPIYFSITLNKCFFPVFPWHWRGFIFEQLLTLFYMDLPKNSGCPKPHLTPSYPKIY